MAKFISFKQLKSFLEITSSNVHYVGFNKSLKEGNKEGIKNNQIFHGCSGYTLEHYVMNLYIGYGETKSFYFKDSKSLLDYFNEFFNFETMEIVEPTSSILWV